MGRIERGAPPAGVGLRGKGAADGAHSGAPGAAGLGGRRSRQGALGPPGVCLIGTVAGRNHL
jgi:hypothetical protein